MSFIITIDGPAAAGKSTVARELSRRQNLLYLDSGALYRAMAWKVLQAGIAIQTVPEVTAFCCDLNVTISNGETSTEVWVDFENVTPFLRNPDVTRLSSLISTYPGVRSKLLSLQRDIAKEGVVAEGRDMGTVVFPNADIKFYLDADINVRGGRRFKEFQAHHIPCDMNSVVDEIEKRDQRDRQREVAPLYAASDALIIDSTSCSLEEVVSMMEQKIQEKKGDSSRLVLL